MSKNSTLSYATPAPVEDLESSGIFTISPAATFVHEQEVDSTPRGSRPRLAGIGQRSNSKFRVVSRKFEGPTSNDTSTDFDRKYPPDLYGQEASDNARVWQVYCDESAEHDTALLEGWNKTLDILLIFAGLFSAVSTTFIIESYRSLQPDYSAYVANVLFLALSAGNSSAASLTTVVGLPKPNDFVVSASSRWTNGLWFVSLVISLSVALLSILAKQWLDEYRARITGPFQSARYWARRRALYFRGLKNWHLPTFISTLPVFLHVALFLFFAGLVLFLWPLDRSIAYSVLAVSGLVVTFYWTSVLVPLWRADCPTRIPLIDQLLHASSRLMQAWRGPTSRLLHLIVATLDRLPRYQLTQTRQTLAELDVKIQSSPPKPTPDQQERQLVESRTALLDANALRWLLRASPAQEVIAVGVQAIGALPPWSEALTHLRSTEVPDLVRDHVEMSFPKMSGTVSAFVHTDADATRCARYLRSWISIYIERGVYSDSQLLTRLIRLPMPSTHDLPLLRFIIRWTLDHYMESTTFLANLKKKNVITREREQWVFLPSTVLQGVTLVVLHSNNRMHSRVSEHLSSLALSAVIHMFHAGRLWDEQEEDLRYAADNVGSLLIALGDRYVDTTSRSGVEACIEYWSMVLNRTTFYRLDDDDVHVAAKDLGLLVARNEALRKSSASSPAAPQSDAGSIMLESQHEFAAFVASPAFLQHSWDLHVLEAMAHAIQRAAALGLSVEHMSKALSHLTLSFKKLEENIEDSPEARTTYKDAMNAFADIVSGMFNSLAFPVSDNGNAAKHPLLPSPSTPPQETLLYFLRRHNDGPSAWQVLHEAGWTAMSRLIVADALAANLCAMKRNRRNGGGQAVNELIREFFSVNFITKDSMSKARSLSLVDDHHDYTDYFSIQITAPDDEDDEDEDEKSQNYYYGADRSIMVPEVVRLAQHCGELERDWWDNACKVILVEIEEEEDSQQVDGHLRDFMEELLKIADERCDACGGLVTSSINIMRMTSRSTHHTHQSLSSAVQYSVT